MNRHKFHLVMLALILSVAETSCKSGMKTASISNITPHYSVFPVVSQPSRTEAEEQVKFDAMKERIYRGRLFQYFDAIANAENVIAASKSIDDCLTLFTSSQVPVRMVVNQKGSEKDYGQTITIWSYLNVVRDQRKNVDLIERVKLDKYGKITEVELKKNNIM